MRFALSALALLSQVAPQAAAAERSSEYTDLDTQKHCVAYASSQGEGDWASLVCAGYRGYPVFVGYDDARESVFYGFPKQGENEPAWESFVGFNSSGPRIEWRLEKRGENLVPIAAIHRRFVSDPENPDKNIEVLVVSKVAQPAEHDGCTVGLVLASGNPKANETARRIADEQAAGFACGADERVVVGEPLPEFGRQE